MGSPLDVFRKPHPVRVYGAQTSVEGVRKPGVVYDTSITCSVQRINANQQQQLTERGMRLSDARRIYSASKLPTSDEMVTGAAMGTPAEDSLTLATGEVITFVDAPGKGTPGEVLIDQVWYKVDQRIPMQNGVINHYQYILYKVNANA